MKSVPASSRPTSQDSGWPTGVFAERQEPRGQGPRSAALGVLGCLASAPWPDPRGQEGSRGWEWGPVSVRGEGLTSSRELHPSCEPCWLKGWGPLGHFSAGAWKQLRAGTLEPGGPWSQEEQARGWGLWQGAGPVARGGARAALF